MKLKDMLENTMEALLDFRLAVFAIFIGYLYLLPVYLLSKFIPQLKQLISDYDEQYSWRSNAILSLVSGSIFYGIFLRLALVDYGYSLSPYGLIAWFVVFYVWGYFSLYLLNDLVE